MAAATERRLIVKALLESAFYCGTIYRMPLHERLKLVKLLEGKMFPERPDNQKEKAG